MSSSNDNFINSSTPPRYPLFNQPTPYIFHNPKHASSSSKLLTSNSNSNSSSQQQHRHQKLITSAAHTDTTEIVVDEVVEQDVDDDGDESSTSATLAIHPLSTPIEITNNRSNDQYFHQQQQQQQTQQGTKRKTESQHGLPTISQSDELANSPLGSATRPPIKRRLLTDSVNIDNNNNKNTATAEDQNVEYDSFDEACLRLPLPSPSASPIHSSSINDLGLLPPDSLTKSNSDTTNNSIDRLDSNNNTTPDINYSAIEQILKNSNNADALINNLTKSLPKNLKNILLYKLLERSDRGTLSALVNHTIKYLKFDMLSNFPTELAIKVLSYLDHKSLLNVLQVCKSWAILLNNSDKLWQNLIIKDEIASYPIDYDREIANSGKLIEKYYSIDESLYSKDKDDVTKQCFKPNLYKLIYKKYSLIDKNWNTPSYQPHRVSLKAHCGHVITCLQFDEDKIVTGADDKIMNVFDTNTGKKLKVLEGHDGGVWGLKYIGNTLVSASTDKTLRVWNLKTGKCTHILKGHNSTVRCLEIIQPVVIGKNERDEDIIFPKKPILVTGSRDHNLNMWDLSMVKDDEILNEIYGITYTKEELQQDEEEYREFTDKNKPIELTPRSKYFLACLTGHTASVRAVSVYGRTIVSGSYDFSVRVWDAKTKSCKFVLHGHTSKVYTTAIDHERNRVLSGSLDSNVNIWDLNTGAKHFSLTKHLSLVGLIQLSPQNLVTGAADATVKIWDPETGEYKRQLEGHTGAITCFQHDDKRVVTGSTTLIMWDIKTGKMINELLSDTTGVWQVRFNNKTCVAAVQKNNEAWIEILDFEP